MKSKSKDIVSAEYTQYEDTVNLRDMLIITSQKDDIEDLGNPQLRDMHSASTYKYIIPVYKTGADVGYAPPLTPTKPVAPAPSAERSKKFW